MKKAVITVTEAARNFADCVNRVRYQNTSFVLVKNGKPVAWLSPANEKACTGRELSEALENAQLSSEEARAWHKDLLTSRRKLSPPGDKWR
jgi:prevent-host-death family protein